MKKRIAGSMTILAMFAAGVLLVADGPSQPDLTGSIGFDVHSKSGRVETLAIKIGDGGTGPFSAILAGDSSLPTHAIYRPRDLSPFGGTNLLPIVAFANGGCRNSSGEFRNMLSEIASHGFLVVAIGPAGNAVVMGSEGRTGTSGASQLLDGVTWAAAENDRQGSEYYHKIATTKVAVMGQSCGGGQAIDVSLDPRVTTSIILNSGAGLGAAPAANTAPPAPPAPAAEATTKDPARPGEYGTAPRGGGAAANIATALSPSTQRYGPFEPPRDSGPMGGRGTTGMSGMEILQKLHHSIAFFNGGPRDIAYASSTSSFGAVQGVPSLLAYQDVGHYPGTYREPNGGAFAKAVSAWLEWQLKGDSAAATMFIGKSCGMCSDPTWKMERKNIP